MTRAERTWHWRLWLIIAPLLAVLLVLALARRPGAEVDAAPSAEQRGQP